MGGREPVRICVFPVLCWSPCLVSCFPALLCLSVSFLIVSSHAPIVSTCVSTCVSFPCVFNLCPSVCLVSDRPFCSCVVFVRVRPCSCPGNKADFSWNSGCVWVLRTITEPTKWQKKAFMSAFPKQNYDPWKCYQSASYHPCRNTQRKVLMLLNSQIQAINLLNILAYI